MNALRLVKMIQKTVTIIAGLSMPLNAQLARELTDSYDRFKLNEITSRRFSQAEMLRWLKQLEKDVFKMSIAGKSAEGRTISLLTVGSGATKVLLWSQMHGDESTATMALLDMLSFFARNPDNAVTKTIRQKLTLFIIPMLNPDGAERFQRRTAQLIDMNRDAMTLQTPEARILKTVHHDHEPQFGFNLHDQDPHYTVGQSKKVTAIALLAPATDDSRADNAVRARAKKVAAAVATVLNEFIPGHIAKYDDTFEPRAFGDNIQKWGTSTVLIESGGWMNDREKMFLRKLNCIALLTTLNAIADESYATAKSLVYEQLPFNTKNLFDIIIRGAMFQASSNIPAIRVDAGFNLEEQLDPSSNTIQLNARLVDVGDLSTYAAFDEMLANGAPLDPLKTRIDALIPANEVRKLFQPK